MTKLMFLLWGDDLAPHDPRWHADLAAAGVLRLQVNVDDEPVRAVVSLWVDGDIADALANIAILRRLDELTHEEWLHRWLEHHTPVAIETQATFGYLQNVVVEAVTPDAPHVDALVEELFPPEALSDIHAFYGSGGDDAELSRRMTRLMDSVATFGADRDLDLVPSSRYLYEL